MKIENKRLYNFIEQMVMFLNRYSNKTKKELQEIIDEQYKLHLKNNSEATNLKGFGIRFIDSLNEYKECYFTIKATKKHLKDYYSYFLYDNRR